MIAEEIEVSAATPNVSVSLQIESFQGGRWRKGGWGGGEAGEEGAVLAHYTRFLSDSRGAKED